MNPINSLPMYFPPGFDMATARTTATLTEYAYDMYAQWVKDGKPRNEKNFHWTPPTGTPFTFSTRIWSSYKLLKIFNKSEPFGFVAKDKNNNGYLVFRGTDSDVDWLDDVEVSQRRFAIVPGYGNVHEGFYKLYKSLRSDVFSILAEPKFKSIRKLYVTGHSLGCGLSTLAVPDILNKIQQMPFKKIAHYNFASPRVGSPAFTNKYNGNGVTTFRVVNTCDIVPTVPLSTPPVDTSHLLYKHVGTPVDFTAQYGSIGGNHSLTDSYCYAIDNPNAPENPNP